MKPLTALSLALLSGCSTAGTVFDTGWERPQTIEEGLADCDAAKHSPVVYLGVDPTKTTIRRARWLDRPGFYRDGEYSPVSHRIWVVNKPHARYHEYIHRGLRLAGERFNNWSGTFRDEEHQLIWTVLDRDFPGLQDGKESRKDRRWARERWSRPEYQVRLAEIEWKARQAESWCGRNGR